MMTNQKRIAQEYYNTNVKKPNKSLLSASSSVLREPSLNNGNITVSHSAELIGYMGRNHHSMSQRNSKSNSHQTEQSIGNMLEAYKDHVFERRLPAVKSNRSQESSHLSNGKDSNMAPSSRNEDKNPDLRDPKIANDQQ